MAKTQTTPSRLTAILAARFANADRIGGFIGSGALRPLRFGFVGAITFVVQIGLLLGFKALGLGSIVAYALALTLAVQFNFIVNQLLVWQDRRMAMFSRRFAERWVTFHGCTALSLVVNMSGFVIAQMFIADIPAAVVGVGASTAIKFLSLDKLAFRPII